MGDDQFSKLTKELLAKRAGHICSNPSCGAPTVGPSLANPTKAVNAGVGSHISANSAGGARYDANLTSEQRRDIGNGIWLCQNCAHIVDANNGDDHSIELLKKWKREHEEKIAASIGKAASRYSELAGKVTASGIGNIIGADIQKPTRIQPGTTISATGIGNVTGVKIGGN